MLLPAVQARSPVGSNLCLRQAARARPFASLHSRHRGLRVQALMLDCLACCLLWVSTCM